MKELWRLILLFSPYKIWIVGGILLSSVSVLANITLMAVSGWFIAAMAIAGLFGAVINYFTPAAIIRACAILRIGGRYSQRLVTHEATFRILAHLRRWLYERLEPFAPAVLGKKRSGDILSRLRGDIDVLERFYLSFLVPVCVGLLVGVAVVFVSYLYHPFCAAIIGGAMIPGGAFLPFAAFWAGRKPEEVAVDINAQISADLAAGLQGMGEILIYDESRRYHEMDDKQYKDLEKQHSFISLLDCAAENAGAFLFNVAALGMLFAGAYLAQEEVISFPDVAMLTLLTLASYEAVQPLVLAGRSLGGVIRAARRVFEIAGHNGDIVRGDEQSGFKDCYKPFSLVFEGVDFGYDPASLLFDKFDFEIRAGQKIMLVGPSGAGKSSLLNLALRFWKPQGGNIILNGQNLADYEEEELRNNFSVVTQNPYIFADSLRRNLLVANSDASSEMLEDVCERAGLSEMIAGLADGYDTYLGENGRKLSGGQVKRLALARALLKDAPCLILDEVGEGLDYEMERDILERVINNSGDAAIIYITHRHGVGDMFDEVFCLS